MGYAMGTMAYPMGHEDMECLMGRPMGLMAYPMGFMAKPMGKPMDPMA